MEEEFDSCKEEEVMVGQLPVVAVPRHIKKRALRNKTLSVGFNDKELRDFVTGFHKRKKKKRKEAQRQLQEKDRLKRIEARKKRKHEREMAMYGRVLSSGDPIVVDSVSDDAVDAEQDNGDIVAPVSERKMYEDNNTTITVTTSAICREGNDLKRANMASMVGSKVEKRLGLGLKKKPFKKTTKHKSNKKREFGKKAKQNRRKE